MQSIKFQFNFYFLVSVFVISSFIYIFNLYFNLTFIWNQLCYKFFTTLGIFEICANFLKIQQYGIKKIIIFYPLYENAFPSTLCSSTKEMYEVKPSLKLPTPWNDKVRESRSQFHQHFTSSFCINILSPKNYKAKL